MGCAADSDSEDETPPALARTDDLLTQEGIQEAIRDFCYDRHSEVFLRLQALMVRCAALLTALPDVPVTHQRCTHGQTYPLKVHLHAHA